MATPKDVTLDPEETQAVNTATALITLAKMNMQSVWSPIRKKYDLPQDVTFDRETGKVIVPNGG